MTKAQARLYVEEVMKRKWFLLIHSNSEDSETHEEADLGIYSTRELAIAAMERMRNGATAAYLGCCNHSGGHLYPDEWDHKNYRPTGKPPGANSPKYYSEDNYFQITEVDLNKDWF